jgi:hypothetical protein
VSKGDGIRTYAGEFLLHPAGLELSMNWCGHACSYCFSNAMKPNRRADFRSVVGLLSAYRQRKSREARLLQAGVPMLVSNHVDPFAGTNAAQFEPIWELCVELGVPLTWQTRGAHKPQRAFLDRVVRETPRSVWYISIPMLDDEVRKQVEPHAPSIGSRLELIDQLVGAGHVVTVGVNPLCADWLPQFEPLIDRLAAAGVWGVWAEKLYMGKHFKGNISERDLDRIGREILADCGGKGRPVDRAHAIALRSYASSVGMQVFSAALEDPSSYFEPYHQLYPRVMPYWHQVINAADASLEEGDTEGFAVITLADAVSVMEPLMELDWSEPLRHSRARLYRELTQPYPGGPLPKQDVAGFWSMVWDEEAYAKGLGLLKYTRMAFAALIDGDEITPLLDEQGHRLVVYRRTPWPHLYAHVPELG